MAYRKIPLELLDTLFAIAMVYRDLIKEERLPENPDLTLEEIEKAIAKTEDVFESAEED